MKEERKDWFLFTKSNNVWIDEGEDTNHHHKQHHNLPSLFLFEGLIDH